jgi:hypothetical protein
MNCFASLTHYFMIPRTAAARRIGASPWPPARCHTARSWSRPRCPRGNASSSRWLSPARLAILDEATSHLDPVAAAHAERAFAGRPGTLIVIAHRMSSALRAERVLVLDGSCARIGDNATLLATSPLYRDLVGHWQADHPTGTSARASSRSARA